ncbi:MAG TPA: DUF4810 domain-containing protein [Desulfuromonadales bacterium]|nr:DUF4810 domain-containing protein [Desulfuromonadales bacterium]
MKKLVLMFLIVAFFAVGCAPKVKPMYYWGNYSQTLYSMKKNPGDKTTAAHQACLVQIIKDSEAHNTRVPPGVYGELGFMCMQEKKDQDAIKYFKTEETTYPESSVLMEKLIASAKSDEKSDSEQK